MMMFLFEYFLYLSFVGNVQGFVLDQWDWNFVGVFNEDCEALRTCWNEVIMDIPT